MKYCVKCGAELFDEAVICVKCGCPCDPGYFEKTKKKKSWYLNGIQTAAYVFCLINIFAEIILINVIVALFAEMAFLALYVIPLCVMFPLVIIWCYRVQNEKKVGVGLKVCILIFVSLIAGILLLCEEEKTAA